jgi:hypothetical protein
MMPVISAASPAELARRRMAASPMILAATIPLP